MLNSPTITKELQTQLWKIGFTIFWSTNAILIFTIAIDIIFSIDNWLEIVFSKSLLIIFFFITYNLFKDKYKSPNILIHLVFLSFNFLTLLSIATTTGSNKIVYVVILLTSFVALNCVIIWDIINSFFQYLSVIVFFIVLVRYNVILEPSKLLNEFGYLFLTLGFVSMFFPKVKLIVLTERIAVRLKSNEKIEYLEKTLSETTSNYNLLKEKVLKKNNESKFLFQQISKSLDEINTLQQDKISTQIKNLKNKGAIFFKPLEIGLDNTSNTENYKTSIIDLRLIFLKIFKTFENQFLEKHISCAKEIATQNTLVMGNEDKFNNIFYNIFNFLLTFSKEDDAIKIELDSLKNNTIFSITNETNGLNTVEIESYFRDLEYVNYDHKKHSDNTKIGLRISKQLTQKMNGYFSYVSSEEMGFNLKIQFKTYHKNTKQ